MAKTLEELKAENAAVESVETEAPQAEVETEEVEAVEEETEDAEEVAETSEDDAEETETEAWMQADEQTSDNDDQSVPVAKHAQMRGKLKGTIKEQSSEIEQLKAEVEALKSANTQQPVQTQYNLPPRPTLDQFDYDEEKHNAAMDAWYDARMDAKLNANTQQANQTNQQQQAANAIQTAVDSHYEKAEKLIEQSGIAPETYKQADVTVRRALEEVRPGQGDTVADFIISVLGDGSERVMYNLGVNKAKLQKLQADLVTDPSGMKAVAYLGRLSAELSTPKKRKSNAPAPSRQLSGDASGSDPSKAWLKKYKAAGDDVQKRFNIRREAKQSGINVKDW